MNSNEYEVIMESKRLIKQNKIDEAISLLEEMANSKSKYAIYELGILYKEGKCVEQNIKKAFNLFVYSGELGNLKAYYDAGKIFLENKDYKNAKRYFEKAKYSSEAYLELGNMALKGKGMNVSKHQAFLYFYEASKLGSPEADYLLADAYINGNGIKMDVSKGKHYLNKALRKGVIDSLNLKELLTNRI